MTINKPVKTAATAKIDVKPVSPAVTSETSSSTKTTGPLSKKGENKGMIAKIKSFFGMS